MTVLNIKAIKTILIFVAMTVMEFGYCTTIEIFTDSLHPVHIESMSSNLTKNTIFYYNLDQLSQLVNQMNSTIAGSDSQEAFTKSKSFLAIYQNEMSHAVKGIQRVNQYHILSIPTIVFDENIYQVQGQTGLQMAVDEYQEYLREKNEKTFKD